MAVGCQSIKSYPGLTVSKFNVVCFELDCLYKFCGARVNLQENGEKMHICSFTSDQHKCVLEDCSLVATVDFGNVSC